MKCKICDLESEFVFNSVIMDKFTIKYYHCQHCGFLQTEEPYWLEESYNSPINITDTGIMQRNIYYSQKITPVLYYLFDRNAKFLDFAGGYGIFTRLMRDIGFDFYWQDLFSQNLVARGFERTVSDSKFELITSFESFEHFVNPIKEIGEIFKISSNVIFSTLVLPDLVPNPSNWWYYGTNHGQHISFYQMKTLKYIAKRFNKNYYTDGASLHLFTDKILKKGLSKFPCFDKFKLYLTKKNTDNADIDNWDFLLKYEPALNKYTIRKLASKTELDSQFLINKAK